MELDHDVLGRRPGLSPYVDRGIETVAGLTELWITALRMSFGAGIAFRGILRNRHDQVGEFHERPRILHHHVVMRDYGDARAALAASASAGQPVIRHG